jgi:hypothetical protein
MIDSGADSALEPQVCSRCDCGCGDPLGISFAADEHVGNAISATRAYHRRVLVLDRGVSLWALLCELINVPWEQ